jgi:hypothetical protein
LNTRFLSVLVIIVIIVVAAAALYIFTSNLTSPSNTDTIITATTGVASVQIVADNLTVGYQSGLWEIVLKNTGQVAVTMVTVYLETPTRSELCSASSASSGLSFSFCPSTPGNPLPSGVIISGSGSGVGEGSGTVGSSYPVDAKITFANGNTSWVNSTVTATNPS